MQGVLALLLACGGVAALVLGTYFSLAPPLIGTLTGALIGSAATMLGTFIGRLQSRGEKRSRIRSLRTIITVELVNVSLSYIQAQDLILTTLRAIIRHDLRPEILDFSRLLPREMPFTAALGTELLLLSEPEIDVLSTLASNTTRTRAQMQDMSTRAFGLLPGTALATSAVAHDMTILAQAFERIAPERKLQFQGGEPELASARLRRLARELTDAGR
jgi:hypothetical protein